MIFSRPFSPQTGLRAAITAVYRMDEERCVEDLLTEAELPAESLARIEKTAQELVTEIRKERMHKSGLDAFLLQYNLSSEEGIALMCLAEALLRVPDAETRDDLIRDKITRADWQEHVGKSEVFFVNAATWGLMLTGKVLSGKKSETKNLADALKRFISRSGEPVIRTAVSQAMGILGNQFVKGRTIEEALKQSVPNEKQGYRYSYDMLGEAARTAEDAERYFKSYQNAIAAIGKAVKGRNIYDAPGISVKLSALHPRYEFSQREWVLEQLIPRIRELALQAKNININFTIDAEEADRLDMSLDVFAAIFSDPAFAGWEGFGLAVQAYQKRARAVLDWLIDLGRKNKKRMMVRLVKGAYWDYEIKDSQVKGLEGYPVFTRKPTTDVSYIACAKKMIAASDVIFPQFATHNAHSVAVILELMGTRRDFEFQCLHGMGAALYDNIVGKDKMNLPCRIYAPVGTHEDLLAYLVRRLLENGANTSFVNRIVDDKAPIEDLIANPIAKVKNFTPKAHPKIPLPRDIFSPNRKNSRGIDLSNLQIQEKLAAEMSVVAAQTWHTEPMIGKSLGKRSERDITDPSDRRRVIGKAIEGNVEDVEIALQRATSAKAAWDAMPVEQRAQCLERAADLMEKYMPELMTMAVREAGKNIFDSVGEVREAVDACRYYAVEARRELSPKLLRGYTGEFNQLQMHGRGVAVCISPWNFPIAIFTAQVVAALVAGNVVIAKPSRQTELIGARVVELLHEAGIPKDVLQLLPGKGEVIGAALVKDLRTNLIILTGSTETARSINQTLANREGPIVPLIAETGGQNAMLVDSTALPEQVVVDAITSAFNSAGQRCSALRVLFLQDEVADKIINMLQGAMAGLNMGDPGLLMTDVGPVIDESAKKMLEKHAEYLSQVGKLIYQVKLPDDCQNGTFFAPRAYEIANLSLLKREVFGPILHVIRYKKKDLDKVIADINNTGYGLTLGIHSRIIETTEYIQQRVRAGNAYVNRNIIGAVIGVQPFGGEGLSGTGPKAGGPHYLLRLITERTLTVNTTAAGGNTTLMTMGD